MSETTPLTIKQLSADEQPREKAVRLGCGALSLAELWALILRTGVPGCNIKQMCEEMMRLNSDNLAVLERRSLKELCAQRGMGLTKAIQIQAVMELVRRYNKQKMPERPIIRSSKDINELMRHDLAPLPHEEIWAIFLNRRNEVTKYMRLTQGGTTASVFDLRMLMKSALLEEANALVLCHNHPSGNLMPSREDDNITHRCVEACAYLDIRFLDHLIIAKNGFYSYCDEGKL